MFARLLWRMLRGNRGRLAVALIAVISGATVVSALLNLDFDVERKLTQEFRALGPNVVIAAKPGAKMQDRGAASPTLLDAAAVERAISEIWTRDFAGAAPFLYIVARVDGVPVVVAGTDLNLVGMLNPTWRTESLFSPSMPDSRALLSSDCIVGRNVARQLKLVPGSALELDFLNSKTALTVAEVLDSGGPEDNQVFADLATVQRLAGTEGRIEFEQLRVQGTPAVIQTYVASGFRRSADP